MALDRILLLILFSFTLVSAKDSQSSESNFLSNTRQLVYEGKRSGEGYFSKDGKKLIFQSERLEDNPYYQIYILNFETGDVNLVSTGKGKTTCSYFDWSSDRILYASSHLDPSAIDKQKAEIEFRASGKKRRYAWDYEPEMDIFSAKQDGSDIKRLTKELGYDAEGAYSPDGKYIIFSSNREAYTNKGLTKEEQVKLENDPSYFLDLYIMNSDGSNVRRITDEKGYDGGPFFSYNGEKIIWRRFAEDGHSADVYTADKDGSNQKRITNFESMSWAPMYHPSMKYIVFCSNKHGYSNFEIFIVDVEGNKEPVRVTYTDGFDGLPVFSPDGNNICWSSTRTKDASSQLFYAKWNHTAALEAIENAPLRKETNKVAFTNEIKEEELKAKVEFLASDALEGRMTGSEGIRLAADYIITQLQEAKVKPLASSYKNSFDFVQKIEVDENKTTFSINDKSLKLYEEFSPDVSSENGEFTGELVFAGYGIKTSAASELEYNSYKGLDVKGKFALILDNMPDGIKDNEKKILTRNSEIMFKVMMARELGAKGLLVVSKRNKLPKPVQRQVVARSGIPIHYISQEIANDLLKSKGYSLDTVYSLLNTITPPPFASFKFDKVSIKTTIELNKKVSQDNNIVGYIPASSPSKDYVVIGAHYDHIGKGEYSSRAEDKDRNLVHNGADDNASGTALVLELAEYFSKLKETNPTLFKKNLVFALWSGEELGLIGSKAFLDKCPIDTKDIKAYLNFDMVGMLKDNKLTLQGLGSSSDWKKLIEKKNIVAGFDLQLQDDPYIPSDGMEFYKANIPMIAFFTGLHDAYHHPKDDIENLNYEGEERIAKFASLIIQDLIKEDKNINFTKVSMTASPVNTGRGYGVSLGTIPDYGADANGLKINGVKANSPAEKAGLKGGDVITKLNGKVIKNIYDYTNMLGELKAGQTYKMNVLRGKEILELEVTPGASSH
jgi:hypothetical protein